MLDAHLKTCVDAHVLQEDPLRHRPHGGHCISRHPSQVAEVHISREVSSAGVSQDIMELVPSKALHATITLHMLWLVSDHANNLDYTVIQLHTMQFVHLGLLIYNRV